MPIILIVIAALVGTSAVSTGSKPGETLFPVKLALENLQETVTLDNAARAELQADHALARLKEVQANIANGNATGLSVAVANLEEKVKGAADAARQTGDVKLAKKIDQELNQVGNAVNDAVESSVTDANDDKLLSDAKDLLDIEESRLEALANPEKAKDLLKDALERATKQASDSAKELEEVKKAATTAKTEVESRVASEAKQVIETHNSIVNQVTTELQSEQKAATSSGSPATETDTSGRSGSGH